MSFQNIMGSGASKIKALVCLPASAANLSLFLIPPVAKIVELYLGDIWVEKLDHELIVKSDDIQTITYIREYHGSIRSVEIGNQTTIDPIDHEVAKLWQIKGSRSDYNEYGRRFHNTTVNNSGLYQIISCCNVISIYYKTGQLIAQEELDYVIASNTIVIASYPPRCFTLLRDKSEIMLMMGEIIDNKRMNIKLLPMLETVKVMASDEYSHWQGVIIDQCDK